jgi:hypothetical protein
VTGAGQVVDDAADLGADAKELVRDHDADPSRLPGWAAHIRGERRPVRDRELERLGGDVHDDQLAVPAAW